ncbi:putative E3 ubiquitin-protein ligase UBR7 [Anopheles darlingi]|uniref:putative E3 ubiquitin-protein ligase UBR7 n=1 Tax=Anopheles darlingi TaxID=43151 RepID=UPI0021000480|nr:putative E3 ubiquitin-protein ligase UBR7 [Anopheles darlingi]
MEPAEDAETSYVTMEDVLKEQEDLEETSRAVLGGSDEKNCTYSKGYVGRQALYACLTCVPEARGDESKRCAICLACSLKCHDNHELLELYTKRKFRCDCGGNRMPDVECKLGPKKEEDNALNRYNQNFSGVYCVCHRPYPDPDTDVADEMLQCIVCEDWYHFRHLDVDQEKNVKNYAEMVCGGCMETLPFLKHYVDKIEDLNKTSLDDTLQVDVTGLDDTVASVTADEDNEDVGPSAAKQPRLDDSTTSDAQAKGAESEKKPTSEPKVDICTKPPFDEGTEEKGYKKGASFWIEGWRMQLCQCQACLAIYKELDCEYLLDPKDTVQYYEDIGKRRQATVGSSYEQGMEMLSQLDRQTQVSMLTEYNRMKERFLEYMESFVTSQQVVTQDDIKEFFARLKRDRRAEGGASAPPYFCR